MEVEFRTNNQSWRLFNLHLKSKWTERDDDPQAEDLREKEARVIRDYIRATYPPRNNHRHLVVGDFNDYKNTAPIRRFSKSIKQPCTTCYPAVILWATFGHIITTNRIVTTDWITFFRALPCLGIILRTLHEQTIPYAA